jgi:hypothetical protein
MTRFIFYAITCGILGLSGTTRAAQLASETVTPQQVMTNEGCAATAAADRAQCRKLAKVGEERKRQCEDIVNLRQRVCMIEVLEALHRDAARTPAGQTPRTPAGQN